MVQEFTIIATAGPNGSISPSGTITVSPGDDQSFTIEPDEGYQIADVIVDGVSMGPIDSYTFFNVSANHTIHVVFSEIPPVELVLEIIGSGTVNVGGVGYSTNVTIPFPPGTELTLDAVADAGWVFDGWQGDLSGIATPQDLLMDGNKYVRAVFSQIPDVTLELEITGNGTVNVNGVGYATNETFSFQQGSSVTLHAVADAGWVFDGWQGDLNGIGTPQDLLMNGDKFVRAVFSELPPEEYTLELEIVGSGRVEIGGNTYTSNTTLTFEEGTNLTLNALADAGWVFEGWQGDLSGIGTPQDLMMNGDKFVRAVFTALPPDVYTLDLIITGGGSVEVNGMVYTESTPLNFDEGTNLSLMAAADAGWEFVEWLGDLTGSAASQSLLMDGDKQVEAVFTALPPDVYTLDLIITGGGRVEVNGTVYTESTPLNFDEGTNLSLMATADAGWEFVEWLGDLTGSAASQSLLMDGDKQVEAFFRQVETPVYEVTFLVDMRDVNGYDPGRDRVYITGSMFGYAIPGSMPDEQRMLPTADPLVLRVRLSLEPGPYYYKYYLNEGWDGAEWPAAPIRVVDVSADRRVFEDIFGKHDIPTGLHQVMRDRPLLYPNPARSILRIKTANGEPILAVRVMNLAGQDMHRAENLLALEYDLIVTGFEPGLYVVHVLQFSGWSADKIQVLR